ncbi:MAG: hypothetical protein HOM38_08250 [Euryarchaeota archaeon]|nr:hypothetical protein [Euryarchaeota archaeon]
MSVVLTTVEVSEDITQVSITETGKVEVEINEDTTTIEINNFAIPSTTSDASGVSFNPHGTITATNLQAAVEQLADQDFRQSTTPTGDNVEEGDTWYDTSTEQFYVYRETSPAVFEWVPIMVGNDSPDSDTLDAGAF